MIYQILIYNLYIILKNNYNIYNIYYIIMPKMLNTKVFEKFSIYNKCDKDDWENRITCSNINNRSTCNTSYEGKTVDDIDTLYMCNWRNDRCRMSDKVKCDYNDTDSDDEDDLRNCRKNDEDNIGMCFNINDRSSCNKTLGINIGEDINKLYKCNWNNNECRISNNAVCNLKDGRPGNGGGGGDRPGNGGGGGGRPGNGGGGGGGGGRPGNGGGGGGRREVIDCDGFNSTSSCSNITTRRECNNIFETSTPTDGIPCEWGNNFGNLWDENSCEPSLDTKCGGRGYRPEPRPPNRPPSDADWDWYDRWAKQGWTWSSDIDGI